MSGKRKLKPRVNYKKLNKKFQEEIIRLQNELSVYSSSNDNLRRDYAEVKNTLTKLEAEYTVEKRKYSYTRSLYTAVSSHAQSLTHLVELIK